MMLKNLSLGSSVLDFLFRVGLSSFFLLGSQAAWFSPGEFLELLEGNLLASAIATPQFWVYVIGVNDALLFLLILSGRWRKGVAVWAALWMIAVIYITIFEGAMEFIEHIGILSLIAYYYFAFQEASTERLKE